MTSDGHNEHRRAKREKVFLVGEIAQDAKVSRVHVLNVSTDGALVHSASPPVEKDTVILTVAHQNISGEVAWCAPTRFGLKFEKAISEAVVEAILPGYDRTR